MSKQSHAQILLDLIKAFETVPHDVLIAAAHAKRYNLVILRLSLAAYRLCRSIGVDGVFSRKVRATRGITAGSGFATTELKLLLLELAITLEDHWAGMIVVKLNVDDMTLAACGAPRWLIGMLCHVADFVIHWLEVKLRMEVSKSKSKAVADSIKIAVAIANGITSGKVSPTTIAQLLGTDSVGGRRRCTISQQERFGKFKANKGRLRSLRTAGVNSTQMIRAAGPPAILYGCETIGVADTSLASMRSSVAASVAHDSGGKNPDIVLLAVDGTNGTLDPAFMAHSCPVQYWALAWWEEWFKADLLQSTFTQAAIKLDNCAGSWWSASAGPTAALLATVKRLNWTMPSASEAIDDIGNSWVFGLDSPAAIVQACNASVRRWRLQRICLALPGLAPDQPDVPPDANALHAPTMLVDFVAPIAPLLRGRKPKLPEGLEWDVKWAASLRSAMNGGQWPQARRASVHSWEVTSNLCQLCMAEVGTLVHRFHCAATRPSQGWTQPPSQARKAIAAISDDRARMLQTRGLLVLRVPAPMPRQEGLFEWLMPLDLANPQSDSATWHFDGSLLDGKIVSLRVTGFGIAITAENGDLLACSGSATTMVRHCSRSRGLGAL